MPQGWISVDFDKLSLLATTNKGWNVYAAVRT